MLCYIFLTKSGLKLGVSQTFGKKFSKNVEYRICRRYVSPMLVLCGRKIFPALFFLCSAV